MKQKFLTFLTLFTLFFGVGWATETAYETLQFGKDYNYSGSQSYTSTWNAKSDKYEWILYGFNNNNTYSNGNGTWTYVKCGSKNSAVAATIKSKKAIDKAITKVVVTVDATKNSNGSKLEVASDADFNNILQTVNATLSAGNVTYTISTPTENCYYRLTFDQKKGSNGDTQISKVVCYYDPDASGGDTPQPTTYSLTLPTGLTGGSVTSNYSGDLTAIPENTSITVTATPSTGYELDWMKANGTEVQNPYTFAIAENTTITAAFTALPTYAITVNNGSANPTSAYEGQTVTLTPTIPDGKVVDWNNTTVSPSTLEINHSDYTFTMPGQAVTVTFAFKDAPTSQTATLTNANIVAAGTGNTGYSDWEITDENGKKWNAHAIKNQHSNATSNYHFLQIKKNDNSGPYFIQVPEYGTKITKLEMTVSNTSKPMTGGSNSATLYFSNSNTTSATGTGVASATGSSSVTIDCSSLNLNSGYITASGAVRIWDVTVTYESGEVIEVPDLYIIGQVNGHDSDPWVSTEGVKMTYNSTNDNYAANIYCTGVNNGTHEGYSLFLFAKSLPYDWNTTSNLYGSGADGSYWGIGGTNESAFGDEIPLYEGSKNSYRLPAGLYTITADLDYTGHQYTTKSVKVTKRDVTMTISPTSGYFSETQTVTMASNLTEIGGKIYYTTNGNDPRDPNSGRIEYKGELTIDATTTFKAVAFIGNLYSVVVEKTYTKTPAAPEISPASCTFSEPFQVTITAAESGATIYYTTDGSNPTDQSTQYTGPFTVSTTTTVKAKAYVDGVYGATATATYTYSNVQPSTGDFVLVTSADQLVAGNEYIILNASGTYALGELTNAGSPSNLKGIGTQDFTLDNTTVSAGSGVTIFTLEESGSKWKFKISDNSYLTAPSSTNLSSGSTGTQFDITISNNIAAIASASNRNIWFSSYEGTGNYAGTTFNVFGNYSTSNTSGYEKVYLYTREGNTVLTTTPLADLEANPEQGKSYVIRDMLTVAYVAADGTAYAKDNNGAAEQTAEDGQIDYLAEKVSTVNTDHSNWIAITGLTDDNLTEGSRLTNVVGTLRDAVNFTLAAQSATVDNTNIEEPVVINQYVPCNFGASTQIIGDKTYFFAHPQIMEYAYIFAAVWKGNDTFEVPENNAAGLTGSFTADLNGYGENLEQGTVYEFHAIVKKAAAGGNGAPRRIAGNGGDYEVMLTEGPKNPDVQTAVTDVRNAGEVAGVKYVNVAGQVAATPWQGVNIVVTRYTDGSTRTTKVVK